MKASTVFNSPPSGGSGKKKRRSSHRKSAQTTVDHAKIKEWVEARGGAPATVKGSGGDEPAGILRIDFPGYSGKATLIRISWEVFFNKFEDRGLAFLYQEKTVEGTPSRFWKLVKRTGPGDTTAVASHEKMSEDAE